jgi:hypothetical protein
MVGGYEIDVAAAERVPKCFAVVAAADWRRALEGRRAIGDVLCAERQVVRTGLDGHRQPLAACGAERVERMCRREMDDVHVHSVLAGQPDEQCDRGLLALGGPRREPREMAARVGRRLDVGEERRPLCVRE